MYTSPQLAPCWTRGRAGGRPGQDAALTDGSRRRAWGLAWLLPPPGAPQQTCADLTAFHRATGEVVWRKALRAVGEGYGPAVVAHVAGRDQLLQLGGTYTRGCDPETGALLWECEGPAKKVCVSTAVFDNDTVYATGGYPNRRLMAIRANGTGDVTQSHLTWFVDVKAGYVPSLVLRDGLLYSVVDQGLMRCYNAADGRVLWEHDFKVPFYSSPALAGDRIYLFDRKGKGYVVPASLPGTFAQMCSGRIGTFIERMSALGLLHSNTAVVSSGAVTFVTKVR